jgi:hypothetical protein
VELAPGARAAASRAIAGRLAAKRVVAASQSSHPVLNQTGHKRIAVSAKIAITCST